MYATHIIHLTQRASHNYGRSLWVQTFLPSPLPPVRGTTCPWPLPTTKHSCRNDILHPPGHLTVICVLCFCGWRHPLQSGADSLGLSFRTQFLTWYNRTEIIYASVNDMFLNIFWFILVKFLVAALSQLLCSDCFDCKPIPIKSLKVSLAVYFSRRYRLSCHGVLTCRVIITFLLRLHNGYMIVLIIAKSQEHSNVTDGMQKGMFFQHEESVKILKVVPIH